MKYSAVKRRRKLNSASVRPPTGRNPITSTSPTRMRTRAPWWNISRSTLAFPRRKLRPSAINQRRGGCSGVLTSALPWVTRRTRSRHKPRPSRLRTTMKVLPRRWKNSFSARRGSKHMSRAIGRIEILPDPLALAHHVAEWMTQAALAAPGPFRISLSGGSTPKTLYGLLASDEFRPRFPWPRVSWYWGDERFVPYDSPDSNYRMTREGMLSKADVPLENIYPIPTDGTPEDAARRYERTLQEAYGAATLDPRRPLFDVTLLGLGSDGHTASLIPGEAVP